MIGRLRRRQDHARWMARCLRIVGSWWAFPNRKYPREQQLAMARRMVRNRAKCSCWLCTYEKRLGTRPVSELRRLARVEEER